MHPEHRLMVSNLVFLIISQLEVRHLEIIKKVHAAERARSRELILRMARERRCLQKEILKDLELLSSMRIIYHLKNSDEIIELTDIGKLIAEEVRREV